MSDTSDVRPAPPTEAEMRDAKVPWPESLEQLIEYIRGLVDRPHTYGTCVYAMSLASVAAFQFVASKLGCTGFQASAADMDALARIRGLKCPFMLVTADKMLFPQYDILQEVQEFLNKQREWAAGEAAKKLSQTADVASSRVLEHWKRLAAYVKPAEASGET